MPKPTKKKNFFRRPWTITWILLFLIAITATGIDMLVIYPGKPASGTGYMQEIEIPQGVGPKALANLLSDARVISSPGQFALWLRITGGLAKIRAGNFLVADNLTPVQVVRILCGKNEQRGIRVTIPEGFTLSQIGQTLETRGISSAQDFIDAATDKNLLTKLKIPGTSAEGYLFPDTYFFEASQKASLVIEQMHKNLETKLSGMGVSIGKATLKTVTLASIVQAEAVADDEMSTIAGVYVNRLNKDKFPSGLLQADPTVAYGCEKHLKTKAPSCSTFKGTLGRRQLDDPANLYNSYKHPGLPPGPICAPGIAALRAALKPQTVPYLYFVAHGDDGRHAFSTTLLQHQKAVEQYRKVMGR